MTVKYHNLLRKKSEQSRPLVPGNLDFAPDRWVDPLVTGKVESVAFSPDWQESGMDSKNLSDTTFTICSRSLCWTPN
jgi:hypothetical protein